MRTSWSSVALALSLSAAGCNSLFGLDSSIPDTDLDGIVDAVDNCPLDPNSQQRDSNSNGVGDVCECVPTGIDMDADGVDDACDDCIGEPVGKDSGGDGIDDGCEVCAAAIGRDSDADGVDDACDSCPEGARHDEDGDGVDDACDSCPTQANAGEAASNGVLGAACDRGTFSAQQFDPFVDQDLGLWPGDVDGWEWGGDVLTSTGGSRSTRRKLTNDFFVETRGTTTGSFTLACRNSSFSLRCQIDAANHQLVITSAQEFSPGDPLPPAIDSVDVSVSAPYRLQLRSDLGLDPQCQLLGVDTAVIAEVSVPHAECGLLGLEATGATTFDYLWIVSNAP